jgi:putative salt-induced outer membrane protein
MLTSRAALAAAFLAFSADPASATLPEPVRAMIDAARATGDETKVRTVIELARATNPDDGAELDAIAAEFESDMTAEKAAAAAAKEAEIRTAGVFENWSGKGEFGAFRATGNSSNTGITTALTVAREGIDWRHKLTGRVDYQRANGVTTREQFFASYEPNYNIA